MLTIFFLSFLSKIVLLITYFLYRIITRYVANLLSSLMILIYVLYTYLLYGEALAIAALINDNIQMVICYVTLIIFSFSLERVNKSSNY